MDLFVLMNTNPRILKVITSQDLQDELRTEIVKQIASFLNGKTDVAFDARDRPDHDELLLIDGFDDIDDVISAVRLPENIGDWVPSEKSLGAVKGLFGGITKDGVTTVMLQAFDRRQAFTTDRFSFFFDSNTFKKLDGIGMSLDSKPTAILSQSSGGSSSLRFVSLHNTRRLFEMDAYYHESTKEEVESFFNTEKFHGFEPVWLESNLDNWIRKKITFINQEGILDICTPAVIKAAALEFGIELKTHQDGENEKLFFPEDKKKLKELLRFLDEDIYQSPITGNRFQSRAKRKIA
ncbi:Kiwa anti-phage protein KwaB-like domain-containing protein [Pseudomonas coronafaciens]|uniref:Kiwa anti-phage protein KwaB-like domain-containing protein n=1 Tax=Pseudomonas coronafaciens TaxID=53409 RepID=UPI001424ACEE|nr:Kiwa anti-phage protein KwaB-like domain-containing protein [Pseudomonas coronafaciens]QIQ71363.1 hypothetical protein HBB04_01730 [Pseudomonas coronafaciens]